MSEEIPMASDVNWKIRKLVFCSFLWTVLFLNYDTGVIPAAAIDIKKEIKLDYSQLAALGTFVNFGIAGGCLFAPFFYRKFQAKWVLLSTIVINSFICILFALSFKLWALYTTRIMQGFTQAFWIVYTTIWVNSFAPINSKTTWIGILQGLAPIGIIVGYAVTSIIMYIGSGVSDWRISVVIQGLGQLIPFPFLFFLSNDELDAIRSKYLHGNDLAETVDITHLSEVISELKVFISFPQKLWKNDVYVYSTCALTGLFFVVFGMQFWGTIYLVKHMEFDPIVAMAIFTSVTITAPLFGVIIGGIISDKMGGYQGENMLTAIKLCCAFSLVTQLFGIPAALVKYQAFFVPLFWFVIFFGSMCVPPTAGLCITSIPVKMQSISQGVSQIIFNIFGYFISPIFSGIIMDFFEDKKKGLTWGWRINLFTFVLSVLCYYRLLNIFPRFKEQNPELFKDTALSEDDKL